MRDDASSPCAVFVSHASTDAPAALRIVEALERAGLRCWVAPRNIRPGDLYPQAIMTGLTEATTFVVIITPASAGSRHVLQEMDRAHHLRLKIIPVLIDGTSLPPALEYYISTTQHLPFDSTPTSAQLSSIVSAVKSSLQGTAPESSSPSGGTRSGARIAKPDRLEGGLGAWVRWIPVVLIGVFSLVAIYFAVTAAPQHNVRGGGPDPIDIAPRTSAATSSTDLLPRQIVVRKSDSGVLTYIGGPVLNSLEREAAEKIATAGAAGVTVQLSVDVSAVAAAVASALREAGYQRVEVEPRNRPARGEVYLFVKIQPDAEHTVEGATAIARRFVMNPGFVEVSPIG